MLTHLALSVRFFYFIRSALIWIMALEETHIVNNVWVNFSLESMQKRKTTPPEAGGLFPLQNKRKKNSTKLFCAVQVRKPPKAK